MGTCVNQNNGSNFGGATASGIDAAGDVVGTYLDTSCAQHGFIRSANGTINFVQCAWGNTDPCTTSGGSSEKICGTILVLSDSAGDMTGSYIDTNGIIRGFLRPAATGTFTSFEDPNAYTSGSLNGTLGVAINSLTSGIEIAGMYLDTNSVLHGFLYTPALTATTTTLTPVPTPNPSVYQEPVTLTASVTSSGGTPANGENVTFMSGTTSLGTAQLTSGAASLTTTDLPVGTDSITAVYGGDSELCGQHIGGCQPDSQQSQLFDNLDFVAESFQFRAIRDLYRQYLGAIQRRRHRHGDIQQRQYEPWQRLSEQQQGLIGNHGSARRHGLDYCGL